MMIVAAAALVCISVIILFSKKDNEDTEERMRKVLNSQLCEMEFLRTIDKLGIEIDDNQMQYMKMRHVMEQHAARMGR